MPHPCFFISLVVLCKRPAAIKLVLHRHHRLLAQPILLNLHFASHLGADLPQIQLPDGVVDEECALAVLHAQRADSLLVIALGLERLQVVADGLEAGVVVLHEREQLCLDRVGTAEHEVAVVEVLHLEELELGR